MRTLIACLCFAVALLAGCAGSPVRATAPGLAGDWVFEVQTGQNVAHGAMTLVADGASYKGTLTTDQGNNVLPVRSSNHPTEMSRSRERCRRTHRRSRER